MTMAFIIAAIVVLVVGIGEYINTFEIEYKPTDEDSKATIKYIKNRDK